jgi:hypothetical protein
MYHPQVFCPSSLLLIVFMWETNLLHKFRSNGLSLGGHFVDEMAGGGGGVWLIVLQIVGKH